MSEHLELDISAASSADSSNRESRFEVLMKMGRCHKKLRDIAAAESTYLSATKRENNPAKKVSPFYKLAKIKLEQGSIENAIALLV